MADFLGIGAGIPIPDEEPLVAEDLQMTEAETNLAQEELAGNVPAVQQQAPAQPQAAGQGAANPPGNAAAAAAPAETQAERAARQLREQSANAMTAIQTAHALEFGPRQFDPSAPGPSGHAPGYAQYLADAQRRMEAALNPREQRQILADGAYARTLAQAMQRDMLTAEAANLAAAERVQLEEARRVGVAHLTPAQAQAQALAESQAQLAAAQAEINTLKRKAELTQQIVALQTEHAALQTPTTQAGDEGARADKRIRLKWPEPTKFRPPRDQKPDEAMRIVSKYTYDFENWVKYSCEPSVSAVAMFSTNSEQTFEFVQTLIAQENHSLATGSGMLTAAQVCAAIRKRWLPVQDPRYEATQKLLSGSYRMQPRRSVAQFYEDFLIQLGKAQIALDSPLAHAFFLNALTPELNKRCQVDATGKPWDSLSALYEFALGEERKLAVLNTHPVRAHVMRKQGITQAPQAKALRHQAPAPQAAPQQNRSHAPLQQPGWHAPSAFAMGHNQGPGCRTGGRNGGRTSSGGGGGRGGGRTDHGGRGGQQYANGPGPHLDRPCRGHPTSFPFITKGGFQLSVEEARDCKRIGSCLYCQDARPGHLHRASDCAESIKVNGPPPSQG
jgi:hypothetical protein